MVELWSANQDGLFNDRPQCLKKFRKARANALSGQGRGRIMFIGDSTEAGSGALAADMTGAYPKTPSKQLAALLASVGIPTSHNSICGDAGITAGALTYPVYDTRVTFGANWVSGTFATLGGTFFKYTAGAVNNLALTPVGAFDTIKVFYWRAGGFGSFATNVDGGSSLGSTNSAGSSAMQTATFTVTKSTHTINIVPANDGDLYICAILAYDSTVPALDFIQAAKSGSGIADYSTVGGSNPYAAVEVLKYLAPDLLWVNLTINNSNNDGAAYLATYIADMQILITAAQISGDVVLEVGPPSNTANATNGVLDSYIDALKTLALNNNCVLLNTKERWTSYAVQNAVIPYRDNLHQTALGYADMAYARMEALQRV
jgi:hypothetical protein